MTKAPPCPRCNGAAVPIVYGLGPPSEAYDRGEIVLGGCVVDENSPAWHCQGCGHEFGDGGGAGG